MVFQRERYLRQLVERKGNGLVKVITGIRRCGKSWLLNHLFYDSLVKDGKVDPKRIIRFAFDSEEDLLQLEGYGDASQESSGAPLASAKSFLSYVRGKTKEEGTHYLLLDEIQSLENFVRVLNSLLYSGNYDIYVTGSNSRFLSSEVDTEFGGRGDRIHLLPLSFSEYLTGTSLDPRDALEEYVRYGGIPLVQLQGSEEGKANQAISIARETYLRDIELRHPMASPLRLEETLRAIASMISTPINPARIENTFRSVYRLSLTNDTIADYISWFEESYLLSKARRYDLKGRRHIGSPYKVYFEDVGVRNAILGFREIDETDLVENLVYNELRARGYLVDVGSVRVKERSDRLDKNGKAIYEDKDLEVDFLASKGGKRIYVQTALAIDTPEKKEQEYRPLREAPGAFKRIIVAGKDGKPYYTEEGFLRMGLLPFLMDQGSLDW